MLNVSWVSFQIDISLSVILLVYFINLLSVRIFSIIVCIHVEGGLRSPFSISSFSFGNKLKLMTIDYVRVKNFLILKTDFSLCMSALKS